MFGDFWRGSVIKRYNKTDFAKSKKHPDYPKMLTKWNNQILQYIIHNNRFIPLNNIMDSLNSKLNITFYYNTIRKYIYNKDLDSFATHKKSHLTVE